MDDAIAAVVNLPLFEEAAHHTPKFAGTTAHSTNALCIRHPPWVTTLNILQRKFENYATLIVIV